MNIKYKENNNPQLETKFKTCDVCNLSQALYTCPRCNINYCNLKCYQNPDKHINCSESFYQEQIIQELKQCKLDDNEERNKMVRILKENIKELENESILPEYEKSVNELEELEEPQVSEEQLVKAFEKEIVKWTPWWSKISKLSFVEIPDLNKLNKNLIKNSQKINISKANPLIGYDIVQMFYIYAVMATVYQLDELDREFNDEIVINMLQIDKIVKKVIPSTANLNTKINLTFKLLLEDQTIFLRDYIDKNFLINMLNQIDYLNDSPFIVYKFIDNLYNSFEMFSKSNTLIRKIPKLGEEKSNEVDLVLEEKPINVFHFNKTIEKKSHDTNKKSRVEIIYHKSETPFYNAKNEFEKSASSLKEAKFILKRLEFYFKWFQLNQLDFKKAIVDFDSIKSNLIKEFNVFEEHKEFMEKNLQKLRSEIKKTSKSVLIEEISK